MRRGLGEKKTGNVVARVLELFPRLTLVFHRCSNLPSRVSLIPPAIPPSRPTVHNPLYKNLERPSATVALHANIKVPGKLWGLLCVYVSLCKFFFSF